MKTYYTEQKMNKDGDHECKRKERMDGDKTLKRQEERSKRRKQSKYKTRNN
jgi:hypothetical protein